MANNQNGNAVATIKPADGAMLPVGELMERIIAVGDVSALTPGDRAHYLVRVAESSGLNPLTRPFDLIPGQGGKLVLYANKGATDQLRKLYGLNATIVSQESVDGIRVVTVEVSDGHRTEANIGAVPVDGIKGEALANAFMKVITKAKRRATLDWCGLGVLDEMEIEGLQAALAEERRNAGQIDRRKTLTAEAIADGEARASGVLGEARDVIAADVVEKPATQRQLRYLQAVAREHGMDAKALDEQAMREFGVAAYALTKADCSVLIDLVSSAHGAPPLGPEFLEPDTEAPDAPFTPGQYVHARGVAPEVVNQDTGEIETIESLKHQIVTLKEQLELSDSDMKTLTRRLKLPSWRSMTIDDARRLRDEILEATRDAIDDWTHEDGRSGASQEALTALDALDAEYAVSGEAGSDRYTES